MAKHLVRHGQTHLTRCDRRTKAVRSQGDTARALPPASKARLRQQVLEDPKLCEDCRADVLWLSGESIPQTRVPLFGLSHWEAVAKALAVRLEGNASAGYDAAHLDIAQDLADLFFRDDPMGFDRITFLTFALGRDPRGIARTSR